MSQPTAYGRGSRRDSKPTLGRDQIIDAMKFLGYVTHDQNGNLYDETYKTANALAGTVKEDVMLGTWIAIEYSKHKPEKQNG